MNWLQHIAQADLSWILSGPNEDSRVGQESGSSVSDGVSVYRDQHGSHRYVYYEKNQAIAGIQVVSDENRSIVANVYTRPGHQRRGLATQLFQRAQSDFPNLQHSSHKEDEGNLWIDSLDNSKPMALPVAPPPGIDREIVRGIDRIDEQMTPETARGEHTPEMEWGGAGSFGVVYKTKPGERVKYTKDPREAETAKLVFEQQYDWVVPMLSPPERIQYDPPIYKIHMKELKPLSRPEVNLVDFLENRLSRQRDGWIENMVDIEEVMEDYVPILDVDTVLYIYERMRYIFQQNGDTLRLTDLHGGNFGWDDDKLKVWDIGPDPSR